MLIALREATDPARIGGKAATLARLASAGIPIPEGVVLPVGTAVTDELVGELHTWAQAQAPHGLVVRSSASVEDGARASYAGLFVSCFAPSHPDALAATLRTVLVSVSSQAVAGYRHTRGLAASCTPEMAVLVQAAVRPVAGGVAFTGTDGTVRIEATWGLSALLLAGHTPPDVLSVDATGAVSVRHVAEKILTPLPATPTEADIPPGDWVTVPELGWRAKLAHADPDEGLLYLATPAPQTRTCCVRAEPASAIAAIARRVSDLLAYPGVDLEWVLDAAGVVQVVQARPITSPFPEAPSAGDPADGVGVWQGVSASAGQVDGPTRVHRGAARPGEFPEGHILVACSAGPELMPALITCAGVIATDAGALCHTAILARELGTPCVVGLPDAPTEFPTGTIVRLDGTAGTVTIISGQPPPARPGPDITAGPEREDSWPVVATTEDPLGPDSRPGRCRVLVPDAAVLDELAADPRILDIWRSAGVVALLLPAGHPAPAGTSTALPLPDAGDLHWLTHRPPAVWPVGLLVSAPSGEVLFHTTLPREEAQPGRCSRD
ncbi:MAG: PEP/pyruvate-binding domain-containing protein [Pseudonocardiaceae bacterium]